MSIQGGRTQKEKDESKLTGMVAGAFNSVYKDHFGIFDKVIFDIYDKLKERNRYIDLSYSQIEHCYRIDINPILMNEDKKTIIQNGKRAAIKLYLLQKGLPVRDSSTIYQKYASLYHLWIYSRTFTDKNGKVHAIEYPETPHKWHVYKCSICARPLLAYTKKLPNNHSINKMNTPWHKKNSYSDTEEPHQGKYAYAGLVELKNWELQSILYIMNRIIKNNNGGWDTAPKHYYKSDYNDDF